MRAEIERKPSIIGRPERYIKIGYVFNVDGKEAIRVINVKTNKDITHKYYITIK